MEEIYSTGTGVESCVYSGRLLDKLIALNSKAKNKVDLNEVKKAIYYAKKYHKNQKRYSGEPYYSHPLEVAYMISDYLFRTDIIVTSILHDTIEDTELTLEMIENAFGEVVANQVMDLTRIKESGLKISSAEMIESLWLQKKYDVLLIKLIDRLHNMLTLGIKPSEKIIKTTQETVGTFIVLAAYLGIIDVEEKLTQLCVHFINKGLLNKDYELPFGSDKDLLSLVFQNDSNHK